MRDGMPGKEADMNSKLLQKVREKLGFKTGRIVFLVFALQLLPLMGMQAAGAEKITNVMISGINTPAPGAFKDTTAVILGSDPHYRISDGGVEWYENTTGFNYELSDPALPFKQNKKYEPRIMLIADDGYVFDEKDSLGSHIAINGVSGYLNVHDGNTIVISGEYALGAGDPTSITYMYDASHKTVYASGIYKGMVQTAKSVSAAGLSSCIPSGQTFDHWELIANGQTFKYDPGDEFIVTQDAQLTLKTKGIQRIETINVTYPSYKTCDVPGKDPAKDFTITTVPENAFKADKLSELFAASACWMESSDEGSTFHQMPADGEFTGRRQYYNNICNAIDDQMDKLLQTPIVRDPSNPPKWCINGVTYPSHNSFRLYFYPFILEDASASIQDVTYTGKALTPEPVVTYKGRTLVKGKDYTYSDSDYTNNISVGKASLKITGVGSFSGPKTISFTIREAALQEGTLVDGRITPQTAVSKNACAEAVTALTGEADAPGATYYLLQAKATVKKAKRVRLTWTKVPGADSYEVYAAPCRGGKYELAASIPGTAWVHKGLAEGKYYKYIVIAVNGDRALAVSKTIHAATIGGKYGNPRKVITGKTKVKLKLKNKSSRRFKASATVKNGTGKIRTHRKLAWESSDPKVAAVNKKGRITAVSKGVCYVYAYAQNGVSARIRVVVK